MRVVSAVWFIAWRGYPVEWFGRPGAVVSGFIAMPSRLTWRGPCLNCSLAIIAGGGIARAVQRGTVLTRVASTSTTGGLANPIVATAELGLSLFMTLLALVVPYLAAALVVVIGIFIARKLWKRFHPAQA